MMKKSIILLFVLFLIPFVSAVENINEEYSVDDNTLALWHFNEGEGNTAYDETNNENDGTITGATWTEGKYGNGLVFDGNNDLISVPYQRVLIPEHLTLEAWVKKSSNARGSVISKNGPYYLGFINEDNKIRGAVYINNVGWVEVDGNTELELNRWYHIAMTYDGESIKVYVNGVEDGATERTGNILITGQALYIGWGEPGVNFYFNGAIDEARISNISRTNFDLNRSPTLTQILPSLVLYENTNKTLNLSNYFSDSDGNLLNYSVSGDININIPIYGGIAIFIPNPNWTGQEAV